MTRIHRRDFVRNISVLATAGILHPYWASGRTHSIENVVVETTNGKIKGMRERGVSIFKGIPYAGQTSGEYRFRRPARLEKWAGVKDTLSGGAPAMQGNRRGEPDPSEDCLFLNVWTPATDNRKRAVMFYSHGGGYVIGSGNSASQDGANLARYFDVVVVQTNHRLGLLGFLHLDHLADERYQGSGNAGLLDIVEGLKWVHENIAQFGGDPNNVMIFGESGGGGKTSCLYTMPDAAPYFHKASIESGPGVRMTNRATAEEVTDGVLDELGIAKQHWKKLLEVPTTRLLELQAKHIFVPPYIDKTSLTGKPPIYKGFGPVVDGVVLPQHPFDPVAPTISKNKPLLVGWNEDEYTFFAWERKDAAAFSLDFNGVIERLKPSYGQRATDLVATYRASRPKATAPEILVAINSIAMMGLGSVEIAEKKLAQAGAPVYLYNFGYKSERLIPGTNYPMGTPHAMDISFKFNNELPPLEKGAISESFFGGKRAERFDASRHFATLWTNFAKTSIPSGEQLPKWPAYNLHTRPTMCIAETCEVKEDRYKEELNQWRSMGML